MIFLTIHQTQPMKRTRPVALRCTISSIYLSLAVWSPISPPTTLMRGSHKTPVNGHLLSLSISSMPRPLWMHGVQNPLLNMSGNSQAMLIILKWAIRQQDNLDLDVMLYVAGTECQTFPWKRGASLIWWMVCTRCGYSGKKKAEDVHASSLSRNKGVKKWLESVEDPETN